MPRSRRNTVTRRLADGTVKTYVYEGRQRVDAQEEKPKTLGDLILEYRATAKWKGLAPTTKALQNIALKKLEAMRSERLSDITYQVIARIQNHLAETPGMANITTSLLKRMLRLAVRMQWCEHNPAAEIEKLKTGQGSPWPWWAIRQFREKAPPEWVFILDLALTTGLRVSDVRALRWSSYDGRKISCVQQKNGEPVTAILVPELIEELNRRKRSAKGLTIVTARHGRPYSKTGFETAWYKVLKGVGLYRKGLKFHGIRHRHGTMRAEAGDSEQTIGAALGHKSAQSSRVYTRTADRTRLLEQSQDRFAAEWQNGKTTKSN